MEGLGSAAKAAGADRIPRVEVLELGAGGCEVSARAGAGEKLTISDPFAVSYDPADLLDA